MVPEGAQDVPVNSVIAVLAGEGEDAKAVKAPAPAARRRRRRSRRAQAAPRRPREARRARTQAGAASSRAKRAEDRDAENERRGGRIFASPLARRIAKESGVDLSALQGSGPHGRIVARDIAEAKKGGVAPRASAPGGAPTAGMGSSRPRMTRFAPTTKPAATISCRTTACARRSRGGSWNRSSPSRTTIFPSTASSTSLLKAREEINAGAPDVGGKPRWKLSVNDFVIKALALALIKVPNANVTWTEAGLLKHKHADVGVAVALDGGLITPIIRHAEEKTLAVISGEMKELAARARAKKLKPQEYEGGSSSVSNLGMYGVRDFAAVINPPQSSILAVGAGEQRPVVKNGKIGVATLMTVTLSADHRAVDGAIGAELLAAFKSYIEKPALMLV